MIRGTDLTSTAVWAETAIASAPRVPFDARTRDATSWFSGDASSAQIRIAGDVSATARGLSVEQHAAAVLAHLRGEADAVA